MSALIADEDSEDIRELTLEEMETGIDEEGHLIDSLDCWCEPTIWKTCMECEGRECEACGHSGAIRITEEEVLELPDDSEFCVMHYEGPIDSEDEEPSVGYKFEGGHFNDGE